MKGMDKFVAGRVWLLFNSPFFGSIGTQLQAIESDRVPTMATDGRNIIFNPEFVNKMPKQEVQGCIAHEVLHIVLMTHLRLGHKNIKVWNMATDYAINLVLREENFTLPSGVLYDTKYKDWSAEKIYLHLMDHPEEQPQTDDWNVGGVEAAGTMGDEGEEGKNPQMTDVEAKAEETKVKSQIQAAALQARKAGRLSAGLDRLVEDVCTPKANWREILQRFVAERAMCDWDYQTTHTRMLQQYGVVYPTLGGEKLGKLAIIVDTSGSVDAKQLAQFAGEINDILDNYECDITVIYCDTKINRVDKYTQDDLPLQLHAVGGGGTVMASSYRYVEEQLQNIAALISYTDSYYFDWNKIEEPSCPAIMACTSERPDSEVPDWMEVVDISEAA